MNKWDDSIKVQLKISPQMTAADFGLTKIYSRLPPLPVQSLAFALTGYP